MTAVETVERDEYAVARQEYYDRRAPLREEHVQRYNRLSDGADSWAELERWADEDRRLRADVFGMPVLADSEAAEIRGARAIFNGCTGVYLRERYGDRVLHVMGVGWFLRPVSQ